MSGTAVAARLARREVTRRPWRSLVVLALVVLPVVLLTALIIMVRTNERTWTERFAERSGTEDLVVYPGGTVWDPTTGDHVPAPTFGPDDFPDGSRLVEFELLSERIRTVDRDRHWGEISTRPLTDPISDGLLDRLDGRYPRTSDEVLLTPRLASALKVAVGDTLELDRPAELAFTVVGIAEQPGSLNDATMFIGTEDDPDVLRSLGAGTYGRLLVDLPPEFERDHALLAGVLEAGGSSRYLADSWNRDGDGAQVAIVWTWIGGAVAFTILGVVIAAAFAVTARRQLRLIGQLMGNGADERTLRATLFLQGTVIGLVGGVLGVAGGVIGLHLFQPLVETLVSRRLDGFDVRATDLLPVVAIATLAATIAAVIPARTAVRTSVLQALAGRRPVGPYPNRLVARGAAAAIGGLVLLAVATAGAAASGSIDGTGSSTIFILTGIAGAIAVLLGTCAMAPAIIARLEPLAGSLRGTARLAARSVARQRTRTGAVVAAIAVVAAGAVAGSTAWLTEEARSSDQWSYSMPDDLVSITYNEILLGEEESTVLSDTVPAEMVAEVMAVLPDARQIANRHAVVRTDASDAPLDHRGESWFQVADDDFVAAVDLHPAARAALAEGKVVHLGWYDDTGYATGEGTTDLIDRDGNVVGQVPAVHLPQLAGPFHLPLISPSLADELGLVIADGPVLLRTPEPMSGDQMDQLTDLAVDFIYDTEGGAWEPGTIQTQVHLAHPYESFEPSRALINAAIIGAATLLSLGVVALGLSLSAAETRDERDVLAAVGARPRSLRRLAGAKAAVLSSTGTLIGIPLGFIPVLVVTRAASVDRFDAITPVFPWMQVGLLVVVVPVIATLVTIGASGIALKVRPVTASTMAFD